MEGVVRRARRTHLTLLAFELAVLLALAAAVLAQVPLQALYTYVFIDRWIDIQIDRYR